MRNKRKRKPFFTSLEIFLKKYQTIFSILIPSALSVLAIIISIRANDLNESQIKKSNIPIWDYQLVYNDSTSGLVEIKFTSLKSNFRIQSIEVFHPFGTAKDPSIKNYGNSWKLGDFEDKIMAEFLKYYDAPAPEDYMFERFDFRAKLPVIIKYTYQFEDVVEEICGLYEIEYKVYTENKLKISSLSFLQFLEKSSANALYDRLQFLYNTDYLGKKEFANLADVQELICKDELCCELSNLLDTAYEKLWSQTKVTILPDTLIPREIYEMTLPVVYEDSVHFHTFKRSFDSVSALFNNIPTIKNKLDQLNEFMDQNPPPFFDLSKTKSSPWLAAHRFTEWRELISDVRIALWKYRLKEDGYSTSAFEKNFKQMQ